MFCPRAAPVAQNRPSYNAPVEPTAAFPATLYRPLSPTGRTAPRLENALTASSATCAFLSITKADWDRARRRCRCGGRPWPHPAEAHLFLRHGAVVAVGDLLADPAPAPALVVVHLDTAHAAVRRLLAKNRRHLRRHLALVLLRPLFRSPLPLAEAEYHLKI